ncbi:MAG: LLM class flavin-dependent oxidoreductase [Actinomycetota bacterium]
MRFSCALQQNRPFAELRDDALVLEQAGAETVWVLDHVMAFPKMGTLLEAWTLLGALAASTTRIRIGTLVTNISYRNPALLAKEAITVDHISGGRLDLGIGAAGTRRADPLVAGVDEWSVAERAERFEEFVELVDGVMRGDVTSYAGRHYRTEGFDRGPWLVQQPRPPLMIAAQGPRTLRVAARFADSWNALAGFGRSGEDLVRFLRTCNEKLDELTSEFGRSPRDIKRSILVHDSGFPWWESKGAFADFTGVITSTGIEEFVFYFPGYGESSELEPERFLELVS